MNKKYIFGLTLAVAITFLVTVSMTTSKSTEDASTSLTYHTSVCVYKNGQLVGSCSHNLVTNKGIEFIKQALNGTAGYWNFTNMTLGGNTSALAATDTDLANIFAAATGLGPVSGTYVTAATGAWNVTYQWTSGGAYVVNTTGIYNTTLAGGNLFAENYFTTVTLQTNDKLNVTWGIWIT